MTHNTATAAPSTALSECPIRRQYLNISRLFLVTDLHITPHTHDLPPSIVEPLLYTCLVVNIGTL